MPLVLTDTVPLVAWLAFAVAFVLALQAKRILVPIFAVLNDAIGWVPFAGGWVEKATGKVITHLDELIVSTRNAMSWLWHLFLWSIRETAVVTEEAFGFTEGSLENLVTHAIPGAFENLWGDVQSVRQALEGELTNLRSNVAANLKTAEHYADTAASGAVHTAEKYADRGDAAVTSYVDARVHDVRTTLENELGSSVTAAIATAEGYADALRRKIEDELAADVAGVESDLAAAVSTLRAAIAAVNTRLTSTATAIEGDIASATSTERAALAAEATTLLGDIATAKQQAEAAASAALTTTAAGLSGLIAGAEQAASAALSSAEATLSSAISGASAAEADALRSAVATLDSTIAGVRGEADAIAAELAAAGAAAGTELGELGNLGYDGIRTLVDRLDLSNIVGWGAAIVLLRSLVESLAAEAGLGSAECRALNRGICGLNPNGWESLLALAGDFLLLADPCAIIPPLEEAATLVGGPLVETLTVVGAGLCSATSSPPADLPVPRLELPTPDELAPALAA